MSVGRLDPFWHDLLSRLDADLSRRAAAANPDPDGAAAWGEALRAVRRLALGVLRPWGLGLTDIEDIAQGVLLKLQSRSALSQVAVSRRPHAYLMRMIRNAAIDQFRSATTERNSMTFLISLPHGALPPDTAGRSEALFRLSAVLTRATDEERELVRLRFFEDLAIGEIARQLGLNYSATAVRLFRLLHRLRAELGGLE